MQLKVHQRQPALILLGILTILAGAIRFYHLSHPSLWYDESMVFRRTCGTYAQLLDCLRTDGFVPLHYSLVWALSQFAKPTPIVLRFFPALCGTLMVPAVYFLSRQMLPRTTSLLAAGFTAYSAFMLFYSRDAKMYMDAWLFTALNAGCVLWWFRTNKSTAWLCWIATGCAACGLQILSAVPIGISLLLLFTQRKMYWQQMLLWLAGVVLILSGPVGYYEKFNHWKGGEDLHWIVDYNRGRTGPELARFYSTTVMMGWEWPKDADIKLLPAERFDWPARGAELLLVIFITACLPWPKGWRCSTKPVLRYAEEPDGTPNDPALRSTSEPAWLENEPQWRIALWLSLWIFIPLYGCYCRSMHGFETPLDAWHGLRACLPHWMWIVASVAITTFLGCAIYFGRTRPMAFRGVKLLMVFAAVMGLCQLMAIVMASESEAAAKAGKPWESMWVPRYIGFVWPMLAVAVAAMLMRLPTKWARGVAIIFLLGLNLGIGSFRILGQTEPPVDLMAADVFAAKNPANHTITWTHLLASELAPGKENIFGEPGQYYLQMLENKPTDPLLFLASMDVRMNPGLRGMPWDRTMPRDVNRIILWSEYRSQGKALAAEPTVPKNWKPQSDASYQARDFWIWKDLSRYRRIVYVKIDH